MILLQQSVPSFLCNMCFKKNSNSATKVFLRAHHYSQVVLQPSAKTSVNTANHMFEKCICLPKKILLCIQWAYENQWCFLITRKCYIAISFRINFDKSQTNKTQHMIWQLVQRPEYLGKHVFWGFVTIEANKRQTN